MIGETRTKIVQGSARVLASKTDCKLRRLIDGGQHRT